MKNRTASNTHDPLAEFTKAELQEARAWLKDHRGDWATWTDHEATFHTDGMPAPVLALVRQTVDNFERGVIPEGLR